MNTIALHLVKKHEGFRRFPYKDTVGKLTIGYGLNLEDRGLPEEDAELLTIRYLVELERSLRVARPVFGILSPQRQAALLDMAYQLGLGGLLNFKRMWAAIENKEWARACFEALDSKWAKQTPKRAEAIALILRDDRL